MEFTFKIGEKIKEAWVLYKEHFSTLLIITLATFAIQFVGQKDNPVLGFLVLVVSFFLSYVWIRLIFSILDKKEHNLFSKEALPTLVQFWNFIKTSILLALCVLAGFILFVIPGFYVLGRLVFSSYISVEKNQGGRASIKEAWGMTKGFGWKLFWKSFLIGLFMLLGIIAFFVGSIITYPVGFMIMIMMYREFVKFKSQIPASPAPFEVVKDLPKETSIETIVKEEVK
ncbi:MAG: hypothetical protein WCT42_01550 [Candidatus Paceibacterota bacterium]|jgi:hypothetical protein